MTNTGSAIASLEARSRCTPAQRRKISWSTPAPTRSAASMSLSRRATTAAADRDRSNASRVSGSAILVFCPHQVDVLVPAQSIGAGSEESARCCSTCAPQRSPVPSTRATRGRSRSTLRHADAALTRPVPIRHARRQSAATSGPARRANQREPARGPVRGRARRLASSPPQARRQPPLVLAGAPLPGMVTRDVGVLERRRGYAA